MLSRSSCLEKMSYTVRSTEDKEATTLPEVIKVEATTSAVNAGPARPPRSRRGHASAPGPSGRRCAALGLAVDEFTR
jgi:hypothetical protein